MIKPNSLESNLPFGPSLSRGSAGLVCSIDRAGGTPLHRAVAASARDVVGLLLDRGADIHALLDASARISAKDEDYRSTPLAWAARNDLPDMVEMLLARGAPTNLPDDEPWATPLAWAAKRGHGPIVGILRRSGATA